VGIKATEIVWWCVIDHNYLIECMDEEILTMLLSPGFTNGEWSWKTDTSNVAMGSSNPVGCRWIMGTLVASRLLLNG
jgi:hypothetical protein